MLHYVIFALALVSSCAAGGSSKEMLENELDYLSKLMIDIEARINATAQGQVSALANASLTCWATNLSSFKTRVENSYNNSMLEIRSALQTDLNQIADMTDDQLTELENQLMDGSTTSLNSQLSTAIQTFTNQASAIMNELVQAASFPCSK